MQGFIVFFLVLLANILFINIFRKQAFSPLLTLSMWFACLTWYCIPGLVYVLFPERDANSIFFLAITEDEFIRGYALEFIGIIIVLVTCLFFPAEDKRKYNNNIVIFNQNHKWTILLAFSLCSIAKIFLVNSVSDFDYLSANSAEAYNSASFISRIVILLNSILLACLILIAIYEKDKKILLCTFLLMFLDTLPGLLAGARFDSLRVFFVLLLKLFYTNFSLSARRVVVILVLAVLVIKVVLPAFSIIERLRMSKFSSNDLVLDTDLGGIDANLMATGIFFKLDSFSTGVLLVKNQGLGSAGVLPYVGSALVFIPRKILEARPIAGSFDGTIYGHPSRLVPLSEGIKSDSMNVGVGPVHIALWHWGYSGFIIFILCSYLYLKLLNRLLLSDVWMNKVLGIISLSIPTFDTIFPSPDVVLKMSVNIYLILFLIFIIRYFGYKQKT